MAGMAGDSPGCEQWAKSYDAVATDYTRAYASLCNALVHFGDALYAYGWNYAISQHPRNMPSKPSESELFYDAGMAMPVTSYGANGNGAVKGDQDSGLYEQFIDKIRDQIGGLPNGDVDRLQTAVAAWQALSDHAALTGAAGQVELIIAILDPAITDPNNKPGIDAHLAALKKACGDLDNGAVTITCAVIDYRDGIVEIRDLIRGTVNSAVQTAAFTIAAGILSAAFTLGAGAAVAAGGTAAIIAEAVNAVRIAYQGSKLAKYLGIVFTAGRIASATVTAFDTVKSVGAVVSNLNPTLGIKINVDEDPGLKFEKSPKHGTEQRGKAAPEPLNAQETLELSVQIKETSSRRVAYNPSTGQFAVFDETHNGTGIYHGHVRSWDELTQDMQNSLVNSGVVDRKGKPQ